MRSSAFLMWLAAVVACGGCSAPQPTGAIPAHEQDNPTLSVWEEIRTTRVVNSDVVREKRGYLELRYKRDDGPEGGQEFIYGEDPTLPLGFRNPSGKTFQYTERRETTPTTREIGRWELERAMQTLLGLEADAVIELVPVSR